MMQQANAHWVVWMSILLASMLSIMPLPEWLSLVRPVWVLMVVIYWILALPERFSLLFAFINGVIMDVFQGSLFGSNALGLLLVAFIVFNLHLRIRLFPVWQQAFVVFIMIFLYQVVLLWIRTATGEIISPLWYFLPSISSALLWPWTMFGLRFMRRSFNVL